MDIKRYTYPLLILREGGGVLAHLQIEGILAFTYTTNNPQFNPSPFHLNINYIHQQTSRET